ncbi:unnamed protein product [Urochloa decumbens]|uniref:non-specific serine/threonine protein kinase n=1 Tax=Urochloa decumbens TaxID=240449 RepID=A0ABC9BWB8_9POAL
MAMAVDGGRWCPSRSPPASPAKRRRFPDDARSDASPKRRKFHDRYAESAVDVAAGGEVEDGEIIGGAAMDVDPDFGNSQERYSYRGSRRHTERRRSPYSRSNRSRAAPGHYESREMERRSASSRHYDHRRNSDDKDRQDRIDSVPEARDRVGNFSSHGDSGSSKNRASDGYREKPRSEEQGREVGHKRRRSEKVKEKEEDKVEYQEKIIEQKVTVQEQPEKVEEESQRTEAIVARSDDQQQMQKKVECVPCSTVVVGDKIEHLKDDNDKNSIDKDNTGKPPSGIDNLAGTRAIASKTERSAVTIPIALATEPKSGIQKSGKEDSKTEKNVHPDNWDDADGYYAYRLGESLGGRYEITAALGKGVFSRVVRAMDLKAEKGDPEKVAIKIIRSNDTMYRAGKQEVEILEKLARADSQDKRHCVRFISNFRYRNHLCLVLESLHMNLRELLKKFGHNIGLKLAAVRIYAKQIFIALKHLKDCKVLHCDIKPDNILVNEAKNVLKLCDFGNAMLAGKNEVTPYLVSRFYRAPEIILGLPYDHPLDMWSVGCCLYELCTGKVLFPGKSNNEMLRLHMELKGPFPKKMLSKGAFTMQHFNQGLNFHATDKDPVTNKIVRRSILNIKPKGINSYISNIPGEDPKTVSSFKNLLDKIFALEPAKRLTVEEALQHPFITGK